MESLFSWEVTGVMVSIFITIALGVLAMSDYKLAKTFFLLAAADAAGGVLMWAKRSPLPYWVVGLIAFVVVGCIAVLTLQSFWYVDRKRGEKVGIRSNEAEVASRAARIPILGSHRPELLLG